MISDDYLNFYEELMQISPTFDEIEGVLRRQGHEGLADKLYKLQQDIGLEYEWNFNGKEETPPGPETARLWRAYENVTPSRFHVLKDVEEKLETGDLKLALINLIEKIPHVLEGQVIEIPPKINRTNEPT